MSARASRLGLLCALAALSAAGRVYAESPPPAHLYLRAETRMARVSVQPDSSAQLAARCVAPCDAELAPGKYQLTLDGVRAPSSYEVHGTSTAQARFESHLERRTSSWVALDVGGVIGVTFIAIGALGGPRWAYYAGGGTLLGAGGAFVLLYRSDQVSWTLTPGAPSDLDQGPAPSGQSRVVDRARFGAARSGLGVRLTF